MAYTGKQIRNGATGDSATQNTAVTGPMPDVAPLIAQAQAAAVTHMTDGHAMTDVLEGHAVSYEWDAGLAISEMGGEA